MPPPDRMFHVLVLGGIALVAPTPGCGSRTDLALGGGADAGAVPVDAHVAPVQDAFPSELPGTIPDAFPSELATPIVDATADVRVDAFPSELPTRIPDAAVDVGFPSELPAFPDASHPKDAGFPSEH